MRCQVGLLDRRQPSGAPKTLRDLREHGIAGRRNPLNYEHGRKGREQLMAAYMSHNEREHALATHHLVLNDFEMESVETALEYVSATLPADHQLHGVLAAVKSRHAAPGHGKFAPR